jgi:hypothetical protein
MGLEPHDDLPCFFIDFAASRQRLRRHIRRSARWRKQLRGRTANGPGGVARFDSVEGLAILVDDWTPIRLIDRTAGERLQGDEVLPTDDLQDRFREPDLPRAVQKFGVHAAQADQEIDVVTVAVPDF